MCKKEKAIEEVTEVLEQLILPEILQVLSFSKAFVYKKNNDFKEKE